MREIVKVRAGSNGEISVAIPKDIRAVVPLRAGDKVMMTARGGQITIEPEIARTVVKAREEKRRGSKKSK